MVSQKYRWDFIGLSTDEKPTSETSEKVVNGSTYYCSDTSKLYVYCDGTWYERKPLGGGGGTSDFNELTNRPKYNGADMTGSTNIPEVKTYTAGSNVSISDQNVISATDTTYSDFTGTDGITAGEAGLVPAPATTDAGKFLSASGLWEEVAGGGGITELTTDAYNYPTDNPNRVALWLLEPGIYYAGAGISVRANSKTNAANSFYVVTQESSGTKSILVLYPTAVGGTLYNVLVSNGADLGSSSITTSIVQTTGTATYSVMSQNATTNAIKDYVDPTTDSSAPTTATIGRLGQIQIDTTNNDAYMCVAVDNTTPAYTWKKITV